MSIKLKNLFSKMFHSLFIGDKVCDLFCSTFKNIFLYSQHKLTNLFMIGFQAYDV